jgi:hypothetical protein
MSIPRQYAETSSKLTALQGTGVSILDRFVGSSYRAVLEQPLVFIVKC